MPVIWHNKVQDTYLCCTTFPQFPLCSLSHNLAHKWNLTFCGTVLSLTVFPHTTCRRCSQFWCGLEPNPWLSDWSCRSCCKCSWLNSAKTYLFLVQICCALNEYSTRTFKDVKFISQYISEYWEIMMRLCKLQLEMKGKYHNMKKHLMECVM